MCGVFINGPIQWADPVVPYEKQGNIFQFQIDMLFLDVYILIQFKTPDFSMAWVRIPPLQ